MTPLLELSYTLKIHICSFLSPQDAICWSQSSKRIYDDLALAQLPAMEIPFQSWYHDYETMKKGPKIPFLGSRTHSVTFTGSWSCRLGELQHVPTNSYNDSQFYIVAYPTSPLDVTNENSKQGKLAWLGGGRIVCRIVWKSNKPFVNQHHYTGADFTPAAEPGTKSNYNNDWIKFTATFMPIPEEEYYLCIQPAPTNDTFSSYDYHHWWRFSLHMSNLVVHITYHDVNSQFLMKRHYKSILDKSQQQGRVTTKMLEAVARSIRLQLARCSPCWDPVLESFFQTTGIPRDTDSLLVLEEIARFLTDYNDVNTNHSNTAAATLDEQRQRFSLIENKQEELTITQNTTSFNHESKDEEREKEEEEEQLREENDGVNSTIKNHLTITPFNSEWALDDINESVRRRRGLLKRTVQILRRFPFPKASHIKRKRASHRSSWETKSITSDHEDFS